MSQRPVRIGCSGWSYDSWRGTFYPEALPRHRWLERYADTFDTVELNTTFYRLPTIAAVAGWAKQVPPGFLFAVKASRYLTHVRRLRDIGDGWARLRERIDPLAQANVLGPILWQLPANFAHDGARLSALFELRGPERHVVEFRNASWLTADVVHRLRTHGLALALGDDARRELPVVGPAGHPAYVRLHYGRRGRRGRYSPAELDRWAAAITRWRSDAEVFVYFNNDWEAFAVQNARDLGARIERRAPNLRRRH
jgi:uncharacterized protein YecE (DUF72 family)